MIKNIQQVSCLVSVVDTELLLESFSQITSGSPKRITWVTNKLLRSKMVG